MGGTAKTLSDLAEFVGGRVIGDGAVVLSKVSTIEEAGPSDITFLANPRYAKFLTKTNAGAIIIAPGVIDESMVGAGRPFLEVAQPYLAFAKILQLLSPARNYSPGVSPSAHVEPSARLGADVCVYPHCYIGNNTTVGARSVLLPGVFLGDGVQVGADCVLHPNVVVRDGCQIGNRVILHAGVVVGSDGFGYAGTGPERIKIPQTGIVVVHDDVEIGANTAIDRATLGTTTIGQG